MKSESLTTDKKTLTTEKWIELFKASGMTKDDLTDYDHFRVAHIQGPCIIFTYEDDGSKGFILIVPPEYDTWHGDEEWLDIEENYDV